MAVTAALAGQVSETRGFKQETGQCQLAGEK
ncbi:hypothetical protein BH20ACI3_BH20ACI3_40340 [soil metagenome]